jgi:dTDP-4-dehydrorhamnose 3,5-epimerase
VQNIAIFLPPGVAHGFQSLEPDTTLIYQHSDDYRPELDTGVNACDPALGITWPLDVTARSMRDAALPLLANLDGSWGYPE